METFQIVYARAEMTALRPTGRFVTRDKNFFPEFMPDWEGRAGVWLRKGTAADVQNAIKALPEYTVYTFPVGDKDALKKAREDVVRAAK